MTSIQRAELGIEGVNDAMYERILPRLQKIYTDTRYDNTAPADLVLTSEEKQLLTTAAELFHKDLGEMRQNFQNIVKSRKTEGGGRIKWDQIDDLVVSICRLDRMRTYEAKHGISLLKKYRGEETS